jgi:3-oxoacyl-[acyl-carrier protein] reductase
MDLSGKKILVTGGSRGIGAGIVQHLAILGAHVAFTYSSNQAAAEMVLSNLKNPENHMMVQMDVTQEKSMEEAISKVLEKFQGLDGLVNNAGITKDQLILRMKLEDFDQVYNVNLRGTFYCSKLVLKPMLKAKKGSIVNISSVVGHTGNPGQTNYTATKAGVEGFSRSLALELSSRNIRSNCVAPGFIESDMTQELTDAQKEVMFSRIPLGKIGSAQDVANAVAFLLSDSASYITGHTLHVNGGLYMN